MRIKKQNLVWSSIILALIVVVVFFSTIKIRDTYFAAFVTPDGDRAGAMNECKALVKSSEDLEKIRPWQEKLDSFKNRNLQDTIALTASDGSKLNAYYYNMGSETTLLVLHGFDSDGNGDFLYLPYYAEKRFNILMPDSRGFGRSGGKYIGYGYFEERDLCDWIKYILDMEGPVQRIVIHGQGMGAAAAIMAAGEAFPGNVKFIVAEGVYSNLDDLVSYELKNWFGLPSFPVKGMVERLIKKSIGYEYSDINVVESGRKATVPALFICGGADPFIPSSMTEKVYRAYAGEKTYLLIDGARHGMNLAVGGNTCTQALDRCLDLYVR